MGQKSLPITYLTLTEKEERHTFGFDLVEIVPCLCPFMLMSIGVVLMNVIVVVSVSVHVIHIPQPFSCSLGKIHGAVLSSQVAACLDFPL